jgi:hypothetical protein
MTASPGCVSSGTVAFKFQAQVTAPLQTVQVAVFAGTTPPSTATFRLKADNAGTPGVDIEVYTIPLTTTAAIQSATSVAHPVLTAGTFYWLSADPPPCTTTAQSYDWTLANPAVAGTASFGGSAGNAVSQIAAFALVGQASAESEIIMSNTGANNAGTLCVNAYVFAPDEQLVACCSCKVTRNALQTALVSRDLTANTLTPARENSVVVKLLSTAATAANCDAANPGVAAPGLVAWANTFHLSNATTGQLFGSETPFTNSTLSAAERNVMTSLCGFIKSNGSGFGICNICRPPRIPLQ